MSSSTAAPSTSTPSGVRFAAYPDRVLASVLAQWIGCQRVIYNAKVEEDRLFAAQRRLLLREDPNAQVSTPLDRLYAQFKDRELTPWLFEVPSQVLREGTYRWMQAKQRQLKGLAKAPTRRRRTSFDSVLLCNDLFRVQHVPASGVGRVLIELGTAKHPVGVLAVTAHRPFTTPNMIVVRRQAGRWSVSFSFAQPMPAGFIERTREELAYELASLSDAALQEATLGLDRNVRDNAVATSDGRFFKLSDTHLERLARKDVGLRRYQRRMARTQKGSANRRRMVQRLASKSRYRGDVAREFSHQTSHKIVTQPLAGSGNAPRLIALEKLAITNMVRRPRAKRDEQGRWAHNGRAQKSALARSILASCWGRIATQVDYKSRRTQALVLQVPAAYTSQACSQCGHTHPDNRHEQRFVCQRCGHQAHADTNAGCNIAQRAIQQVREGAVHTRPAKRVALKRKNSAGVERPSVPVEGRVRRGRAQSPHRAAPDEPGTSVREN